MPPEPVEDQLVDHDLERQVIGACLQRPDLLPQALEHVTADDFYETRAKDAWRTIRAHHTVHGDALDQVLVADQLGRKDHWTPTDAHTYLADSVLACAVAGNAVKYAVDLHTLAVQRRVRNLSRNLQTDLGNPQVALQLYAALAEYTGQQNGNCAHPGTTDPPLQLEVRSARDVYATETADVDDRILGPLLVRRQRVILGGPTGEGKTTFLLQLVAGVTQRRQVLEWTGRGGRVLIIDVEQGVKTIKKQLREAGLHDSTDVDYIIQPDGLALDSNEQHTAAVERALDAGAYDIVIADPLYKLHRGESNDERPAVDLMRRFDAWRDQYGFCLVIPVHVRKAPPGQKGLPVTIDELFGSSAYARGAEVAIGIRRVRDGYSRLYWLKDRDGDLPAVGSHWGLIYDRQNGGFYRDPADTTAKQTTGDLILYALAQSAPDKLTRAQLIEATGKADSSVRAALRAMAENGSIEASTGPHGTHLFGLPPESLYDDDEEPE